MSKKYIESAKLIERTKLYDPQEAVELVCKTATAKFDETIEIHVRLGVDSRTVPVRPSAPSFSPVVPRLMPRRLPVQTMSVRKNLLHRFRAVGSTLTS